MFFWNFDIEVVLVVMFCFCYFCEEVDIWCGVDEVLVYNFLFNYNIFMEFVFVSNMMLIGRVVF